MWPTAVADHWRDGIQLTGVSKILRRNMPCWTEHPWPGAGCNATVWPRAMQELGRHRGTGIHQVREAGGGVACGSCAVSVRMSSKLMVGRSFLVAWQGGPDVCNPAVHHRAFRPPPRVQCADGLGRELLRRVSKASSSSTTYTTLGSTRPLASSSQRCCAQHYLTAALRRYPGAGLDDWQQSWPSGARG